MSLRVKLPNFIGSALDVNSLHRLIEDYTNKIENLRRSNIELNESLAVSEDVDFREAVVRIASSSACSSLCSNVCTS